MFLDRDNDDDDPKRAARRPMLAFILVTLAVGAAASAFTKPNITGWYDRLIQPAYAPPDWVFPPVWTTLYVVMAVAAWRVWRKTGLNSIEIISYAGQLVLNFAWCGIFFRPAPDGSGTGGNPGPGSGDPGHHDPVLPPRLAGRNVVPALSGLEPVRHPAYLWILGSESLTRDGAKRAVSGLGFGERLPIYPQRSVWALARYLVLSRVSKGWAGGRRKGQDPMPKEEDNKAWLK